MKICVAGWYYRPDYLIAVRESGYPAFVVQHRPGETQGLPCALHENRGLEFGAYRQYVENHWDGSSDVFFTHDDAAVSSLFAFRYLERLAIIGVDQAYIFHDENEEYINGGAHGRGIWMRGSVIAELRNGFPADMDNTGVNVGVVAQQGILKFHERVKSLTENTAVIAIVPQFRFAHRGRLHEEMFVYRKTHLPVPGGLVNAAQ